MVLFKKMFANQLSKSYVWRNVVHQRARWTLGVQGLVRVLASFFFFFRKEILLSLCLSLVMSKN